MSSILHQNQICKLDERVLDTRPNDVLLPKKSIAIATSMRLLDYFGFDGKSEKKRAFESGYIYEKSRPMHEYDWSQIGKTMELFDGYLK